MPDVTLGIPLFRSAEFLPSLLARLEELNPPPAEIVFVDDASPDDSAKIATAFAARWPGKARVVRHESNRGIAASYNRIAAESTSEWVHILDADDYPCSSNYYAKVLDCLGPHADVVVTSVESNARLLDRGARLFATRISHAPPPWLPLLGSVATRSGVIYRRSVLMELPFPDPAYPGSDVIHLATLRQVYRCRFEPTAIIHYRIHPGATSSQRRNHAAYRAALARLPMATRVAHLVDLAARRLGQALTR